jgi:hypothetical protein
MRNLLEREFDSQLIHGLDSQERRTCYTGDGRKFGQIRLANLISQVHSPAGFCGTLVDSDFNFASWGVRPAKLRSGYFKTWKKPTEKKMPGVKADSRRPLAPDP